MWARVKLKVDWSDIVYTTISGMRGGDVDVLQRDLEAFWSPKGDAIACFSVRSGFDLLLQAMLADGRLIEGDAVLLSALNVKQMVRAVERLGLVPVPVELDLDDMRPRMDAAVRAADGRAKVFVVAHLFGARFDLQPVSDFAKEQGILLIEDCAQAYDGIYRGSPLADVAMFSFGPIKTKTCLGGGILTVSDESLLATMRRIQADYPVQADNAHVKRALKFGALKIATSRVVFGTVATVCRWLGRDYDTTMSNAVRDVAKQKTPKQLRMRCSPALLKLLRRRLSQDVTAELAERTRQGKLLRNLLKDYAVLPAGAAKYHDYWVFPAIVENPTEVIQALRLKGFDACDLPRSEAIAPPKGREDLRAHIAESMLTNLIVVPCYPGMSDGTLRRQAEIFRSVARPMVLPTPAIAAE
ncbi:MAG: DegT/DnrJ/EryC1/StrS aminotransferase family protein [Alphaproteobacteria bacterium]|nr:DegT/DnrJ/EryC1/StrS aminotransferase family protein [Alphaproteobacteria bacterium]